jgi:hypothetical protein
MTVTLAKPAQSTRAAFAASSRNQSTGTPTQLLGGTSSGTRPTSSGTQRTRAASKGRAGKRRGEAHASRGTNRSLPVRAVSCRGRRYPAEGPDSARAGPSGSPLPRPSLDHRRNWLGLRTAGPGLPPLQLERLGSSLSPGRVREPAAGEFGDGLDRPHSLSAWERSNLSADVLLPQVPYLLAARNVEQRAGRVLLRVRTLRVRSRRS